MAASLTPREDRILTEARSWLDAAFRATFAEPCPLPVLSSDLQPDVALGIDDADGFARSLANITPYWPDSFRGRQHQWALWSSGTASGALEPLLLVECFSCRERFPVRSCGERDWFCVCPGCIQDAAATEDGVAPPCGCGTTPEEAAQEWWELWG